MAQLIPEVIPHFRKQWQLMVSVCLTRMNKVTRELSELEKRYACMQEEMELEESAYNNYEIKKSGLEALAAEKDGKLSEEREREVRAATFDLGLLQDEEEYWAKELSDAVLAPRKTNDDILNNYNSLNRKLDDILYLVVKDRNLIVGNMLYPYSCLEEEETLRSGAERLLTSYNLNESSVFFSNAPVGVLKVAYEENDERSTVYQGAKLFFMKAHLHKPVSEAIDNVEWLTLKELSERTDKDYFKKVRPFVC